MRNIRAEFMPVLPCTIRKTRFMAGQQQMLRVDWEQLPDADGGAFTLGFTAGREEILSRLLPLHDIVIISDYAKGMVDASLMEYLRACGKPVIADPKPVNAGLFHDISLITPNRKEAREMLGKSYPDLELGERLAEKMRVQVLLTLSENGMALCVPGQKAVHIPAQAREVFDVTGAGDTVIALWALAFGAGAAPIDAAYLANLAAAIVVGKVGAATVTAEELTAALTAQ